MWMEKQRCIIDLEIKSEKPNEAAPNKFFKCPLRRSW